MALLAVASRCADCVGADSLRDIGEAVFRAADAAIMAVAEGYEDAQRWSLRQEESFRRAFVETFSPAAT